jgi:hypothetical protein
LPQAKPEPFLQTNEPISLTFKRRPRLAVQAYLGLVDAPLPITPLLLAIYLFNIYKLLEEHALYDPLELFLNLVVPLIC